MYISRHFKHEDQEAIRTFIKHNSFGLLVSLNGDKLWGSHIPMELAINDKGEEVLRGHVSRANEQGKYLESGPDLMAVFTGMHSYISSSWYINMPDMPPTWNYTAVHVYGRGRILSYEETWQMLKEMSDRYEAGNEKPFTIEGMSEEAVRANINGIVAFEIVITDIQATRKLSQNRNEENKERVREELRRLGHPMADEI